MIGLPGETLEQALKTVDLNARIKTDYPWCSIYQPYPETELGTYALETRDTGKLSRQNQSVFF